MRKISRFKIGTAYSNPTDTTGLYAVVTRLDKIIYIFDPAFIHLIRYALATFCTSEMSTEQLDVFMDYIEAFNGTAPFTDITRALDEELVKIALCTEDESGYACGNSPSFTYIACGVDINL